MAIFPTTVPTETPDNTDNLLFSDTSDADNLKKNTPGAVVAAGLPSNDTDSLPQGATNLYMTPGEKVKLAGVQTGAQVNSVDSVNGQTGAVQLDQDDVPDGTTYVRTENNYTNTAVTDLNAATNHLTDFNNPHNTTPALIGLGNVTNDEQLSTTPGNFGALNEKSDIQQHLDDLFVIQDSADGDQIKKVKNQTDLIWKASLTQVWWPSINYYRFNFVSNTTYDIRSTVVFGGNLYLCTVNHQSSGSFAADLALWYWTLVGTGWVPGGVSVTTGAWAPVTPGTSAGDLYIDNVNKQLYIWDGSAWNLYTSPFSTTVGVPATPGLIIGDAKVDLTNGNIYVWDGATWVLNEGTGGAGGVNYVSAPTTNGNRLVFSSGVNADLIDESIIIYTSLPTPTIDMNSITTTGIQNFDNNYISNYNGSTLNYSQITQNFVDTPNQISCEGSPLFATPFTAPAGTQWVEIKVEYDNGVDPVVAKKIISLFDGSTQDVVFSTPTDIGTVQVSWAAGDVTATITAGTPGFFSFGTPDSWCYYNGVSVNNYQNKIHIHEWDITQNTNTYTINNGTTEIYDSNSTTVHNGTMTVNDLDVTNININGNPVPSQSKGTVTIASGTTVVAVEADATNASIVVFNTESLPVGAISYDTTTPGQVTFNSTATETGLVINYVIFY